MFFSLFFFQCFFQCFFFIDFFQCFFQGFFFIDFLIIYRNYEEKVKLEVNKCEKCEEPLGLMDKRFNCSLCSASLCMNCSDFKVKYPFFYIFQPLKFFIFFLEIFHCFFSLKKTNFYQFFL